MGVVTTDGAELYYEVAGEGQPLVLLHDGLLDCRIWDDQFELFSRSYRTIRYDVRGHGRSKPSGGEFSHVNDLRCLLNLLGAEPAHLVGASNGGRISIDFALSHPGMVGSLVLVGSSLSGYQPSDEQRRRISAAFVAGRECGAPAFAEFWLQDPFWAPSLRNASLRRRLRGLLIGAFHGFQRVSEGSERRGASAIHRLSEIRVPVLVVVGEHDDPDNHAIANKLESDVPAAEKILVSGAGHMLNLEKPEEFDRLTLDFLSGQRAAAP